MRKRTLARETALKILYQAEMTGDDSGVAIDSYFETQPPLDADTKAFVEKLVVEVIRGFRDLDKRVESITDNWDMKRMAVLDRNILRMAVYEMTSMTETPPKVVINEAVDLAKKYSGENSGKFVNGILDKLMRLSSESTKPSA